MSSLRNLRGGNGATPVGAHAFPASVSPEPPVLVPLGSSSKGARTAARSSATSGSGKRKQERRVSFTEQNSENSEPTAPPASSRRGAGAGAAPPAPPAASPRLSGWMRTFVAEVTLLGNELKCPICLSMVRTPSGPPCGHVFCLVCITGALKSKPECPLCKTKCSSRGVRGDVLMDSVTEAFRRVAVPAAAAAAASRGFGGSGGPARRIPAPPVSPLSDIGIDFTQVPTSSQLQSAYGVEEEEEEGGMEGGTAEGAPPGAGESSSAISGSRREEDVEMEGQAGEDVVMLDSEGKGEAGAPAPPPPAAPSPAPAPAVVIAPPSAERLSPPAPPSAPAPPSSAKAKATPPSREAAGRVTKRSVRFEVEAPPAAAPAPSPPGPETQAVADALAIMDEGEPALAFDWRPVVAEPGPSTRGLRKSARAVTTPQGEGAGAGAAAAPVLSASRSYPLGVCAVCVDGSSGAAMDGKAVTAGRTADGRRVCTCTACGISVHASCYEDVEDATDAGGGAGAWKCGPCVAGFVPSGLRCYLCPCATEAALKPDALYLHLTGTAPSSHLANRGEARAAEDGGGEGGSRSGKKGRPEGAAPLPSPAAVVRLAPSDAARLAWRPCLTGTYAHTVCGMWLGECFHMPVSTLTAALRASREACEGGAGCTKAIIALTPVLMAANAGHNAAAPAAAVLKGMRSDRALAAGRGLGAGAGSGRPKRGKRRAPTPPPLPDTIDDEAMYAVYSQAVGVLGRADEEEEEEEEGGGDDSSEEEGAGGAAPPSSPSALIAGRSQAIRGDEPPFELAAKILSQMLALQWLLPPPVAITAGQDFATSLAIGTLAAAEALLSLWSPSTLFLLNTTCMPRQRTWASTGTCEACGLWGARNGATVQCAGTRTCMVAHHPLCAYRAHLLLLADETGARPARKGAEEEEGGAAAECTYRSFCASHTPGANAEVAARNAETQARVAAKKVAASAAAAEAVKQRAETAAVRPAALAADHASRMRTIRSHVAGTDAVGPGIGLGMGYAPAYAQAVKLPLRIPAGARASATSALNAFFGGSGRKGASADAADGGPGVGGGSGVPGPYGITSGAHWEEVFALVSGCDVHRKEAAKASLAALTVFGMAWLPPEAAPGGRPFGRGSTGANRRGLLDGEGTKVAPTRPTHILVPAAPSKFDAAALSELVAEADATAVWGPCVGDGEEAAGAGAGAGAGGGAARAAADVVSLARRRTHGYLCCLASGAALLDPSWVTGAVDNFCMPGEESAAWRKAALFGDKGCAVRGMMLFGPRGGRGSVAERLTNGNAVTRARAAVAASRDAGGAGGYLLFDGVTFLLHGEWECPPKNVSLGDAVELITLAGGRVVDCGLHGLPSSATPSLVDLQAAAEEGGAGARAGTAVRYSGLSCPPAPGYGAGAGGGALAGEEDGAGEWPALLLALARQHGSRFVPPASGGPGGAGSGSGGSGGARPCPPLIVLCDEPAFALPPALAALLSRGVYAPMLTPDWLLDCLSTYARLAPGGAHPPGVAEAARRWKHPAFAALQRWVGAAGPARR